MKQGRLPNERLDPARPGLSHLQDCLYPTCHCHCHSGAELDVFLPDGSDVRRLAAGLDLHAPHGEMVCLGHLTLLLQKYLLTPSSSSSSSSSSFLGLYLSGPFSCLTAVSVFFASALDRSGHIGVFWFTGTDSRGDLRQAKSNKAPKMDLAFSAALNKTSATPDTLRARPRPQRGRCRPGGPRTALRRHGSSCDLRKTKETKKHARESLWRISSSMCLRWFLIATSKLWFSP